MAEENSGEILKQCFYQDQEWSGLSESNRHLNFGKSAEIRL
jgi:hypothetical protein